MPDAADHATQFAPGWYPDPLQRFELRYYNGSTWTADVSANGERFVDPSGLAPTPQASATAAGPGYHQHPPTRPNPAATASMVLGIIAIGVGWIPFIVVLGVIGAILAVIFAIAGLRQSRPDGAGRDRAIAGLITGLVGMLICVGGVIFTVVFLRAFDDFQYPAPHESSIERCELSGSRLTAAGTVTNLSTDTASFSVRLYFVRPGTDNARFQGLVRVDDVSPGESREFEYTQSVGELELDCIVGDVHGPLPFGLDPQG